VHEDYTIIIFVIHCHFHIYNSCAETHFGGGVLNLIDSLMVATAHPNYHRQYVKSDT